MNIIQQAADIIGSRAKLARAIGVTRSCITQWDKRQRIPAAQVLKLEQITGISRHILRPDIFGERE